MVPPPSDVEELSENELQFIAQFVSFLKFWARVEDEDVRFWHGASSSSLDAIWNNAEDDVYGELLQA